MHGSESGSVDREHGARGTPTLEADSARLAGERERMGQAPYSLDQMRRDAVLAEVPPERVMNHFKAYTSRRLWKPQQISVAIQHVVAEQGEAMSGSSLRNLNNRNEFRSVEDGGTGIPACVAFQTHTGRNACATVRVSSTSMSHQTGAGETAVTYGLFDDITRRGVARRSMPTICRWSSMPRRAVSGSPRRIAA